MRVSNNGRLAAVAFAVVGPACFDPAYHQPSCGPGGGCPDDLICVQPENLCEGKNERSFDSASSFAAGQLANMTIDARGSLTPTAYSYGGLVGSGLAGTALWQPGEATSWSAVAGTTPTGTGLWRGEPIPIPNTPTNLHKNDLRYLVGVTSPASMTIWLEGEVWLEASVPETFSLQADEVGFLELARPGTADYDRIVDGAGDVQSTNAVAFQPPTTGWYPIRIGFSASHSNGQLVVLHHDGDGVDPPLAWARNRLRARAGERSGALRTVFFQQMLGGGQDDMPPVTTFENADLLPQTTFSDPPPQGTNVITDWSARYCAQVHIEQPGSYTLSITSDDGNRGRLGAMSGETSWARNAANPNASTQVTAMLRAGWNDLTIDYNQVFDALAALHIQLTGPDFPSSTEIPRDRLRPVESADDRLVFGGNDDNLKLPAAGGAANAAIAMMPVAGFPGETVASLDILYEVKSSHWDQIRVELEPPGAPGTRVSLPVDGSPGDVDRIVHLTIAANAPALLGDAPDGTWKLYVYRNTANDGTDELDFAKLTLHTSAGPERIAREASWTSQVLPFDAPVTEIESVTWDEHVPEGTTLTVEVGSCHKADCSDVMWATASSNAMPIATASYLQLRVTMTSDGVAEPELRHLHLRAR